MKENKAYAVARLTMVLIAFLGIANIVWVLFDKSFDFVALPALAEIVMLIEIALYDMNGPLYMMILLGIVIAALLAVYAVCGWLAEKRGKWFTVGLVFYVVDFVFRLYLTWMDTYPDARGGQPAMIVVRALIPTAILVILIVGMVNRNKSGKKEII